MAVLALTLPGCGGTKYTTTQPTPPPTTLPPVTQPPAPTTIADLSATVTSPQADGSINCTDNVRARITVTNRGGTPVTVSAFLNTTGIPVGDCFGGGDRTFRYTTPPTMPANATTVLFDGFLYTDGPACCGGKGCAGACTFQEAFKVITNVGDVPAGSFNYKIFFQNCRSCPGSVSASGGACARATAIPVDAQR
jgi:hypothetical protein